MNDTERLAYEWLKSKGYKNIVFRPSRTPDFKTDQGYFEVKKGYMAKGYINVVFYSGQREKIRDTKAYTLVFNDKKEPIVIINPSDIMRDRIGNVILHDSGIDKQFDVLCKEYSHLNSKDIYRNATVGNNGMIVLPREVRAFMGVKPGDKIAFIAIERIGEERSFNLKVKVLGG